MCSICICFCLCFLLSLSAPLLYELCICICICICMYVYLLSLCFVCLPALPVTDRVFSCVYSYTLYTYTDRQTHELFMYRLHLSCVYIHWPGICYWTYVSSHIFEHSKLSFYIQCCSLFTKKKKKKEEKNGKEYNRSI